MRTPSIDPVRFSSHRGLNRFQTLLLLGLMTGYAGFVGWMLWGPDGLWFLVIWGAFLLIFSPRLSARWVLRMYGARPVSPAQAPEYHQALSVLSGRVGLPNPPSLWWVPSPMVNAFAVGSRDASVIAVTDGLLRTLSPRELVAVLAHETAHIAHGDLFVMGLADVISRITSAMSFVGLVLIFLSLPQALAGGDVDWWPLILLAAAPQVSLLAQLGLSRTREFDADLTAARLTDDPDGLASALLKLERVQNGFLRRIFFPGRGLPEPSWLRTHPTTEERVRRLRDLRPERTPGAWGGYSFEPPSFPHVRLRQRPRGGWWGYWY
ncbi:zinc metalloprotease HtpX [Desulfomicrobium escambiense]|uniref:zinc metalloprotease HtpX n=1 Tax=Desulfomicrobium escambiense TaxID=29503 RepID=UPI00041C3AC2|nr:zinc metalloprotease HtpX [Desulfomicrobium escambiense]